MDAVTQERLDRVEAIAGRTTDRDVFELCGLVRDALAGAATLAEEYRNHVHATSSGPATSIPRRVHE